MSAAEGHRRLKDIGGGTVFSLQPATKAERTLHVFAPSTKDGAHPDARLVRVNDLFYGTTRDGGTRSKGTVFQISKPGRERVLYSFLGRPDGGQPQAQLVPLGGTLYGTTALGGTGAGTVFGFTP